jgi:hypothetical protein
MVLVELKITSLRGHTDGQYIISIPLALLLLIPLPGGL